MLIKIATWDKQRNPCCQKERYPFQIKLDPTKSLLYIQILINQHRFSLYINTPFFPLAQLTWMKIKRYSFLLRICLQQKKKFEKFELLHSFVLGGIFINVNVLEFAKRYGRSGKWSKHSTNKWSESIKVESTGPQNRLSDDRVMMRSKMWLETWVDTKGQTFLITPGI